MNWITKLVNFVNRSFRLHDDEVAVGGIGPVVQPLVFAGLLLHPKAKLGGMGVIGAPGSGKTRLLRESMRSVVRQLSPSNDCRLLVYDLKQDLLSELSAWKPTVPVIVLNPFDARSHAWAIAEDFTEPGLAFDYAKSFLGDAEESNDDSRFFRKASQVLLAAAIESLIRNRIEFGTDWTLRDLIMLTSTVDQYRKLVSSFDQIKTAMEQRMKPPRTFADVMQTMGNAMMTMSPCAAIWENVGSKFSVKRWLAPESGGSVLVLGTILDRTESTKTLLSAIFSTIVNELVAAPDVLDRDRLHFFADELAEMGSLTGLTRLLTEGRSKGARWWLGTQDLPGMEKVYGAIGAKTILNKIKNLSFLNMTCEQTAKWASQRIGESDQIATMFGSSINHRGEVTNSTSESLSTRPLVLPSEFLHLRTLDTTNTIDGIHFVNEQVYYAKVPFTSERDPATSDTIRRPDLDRVSLTPWGDADDQRLAIGKYRRRTNQPKHHSLDLLRRVEV